MKKILLINSSPKLHNSYSRMLTGKFVNSWQETFTQYELINRDIGTHPLPHLTDNSLEAFSSQTEISSGHETRALSNLLIEELKSSAVIVFGVPMYNFSIPASMKSYFDYVARSGVTFGYGEKGTQGYIKDKRVIVITTGGGLHHDTNRDFQAPYIKFFLNFIGLTDITFIRAHGLLLSPDSYQTNMAKAEKEIEEYISNHKNLGNDINKSLDAKLIERLFIVCNDKDRNDCYLNNNPITSNL